jgi:hypothetical protein
MEPTVSTGLAPFDLVVPEPVPPSKHARPRRSSALLSWARTLEPLARVALAVRDLAAVNDRDVTDLHMPGTGSAHGEVSGRRPHIAG